MYDPIALFRGARPSFEEYGGPRGVLLVSEAFTPLVDGVVRIVSGLSDAFTDEGIYAHVLAPSMPGYVDTSPRITRMPSLPLPGNAPYRLPLPCDVERRLPRELADRIDVVHLHSSFETARSVTRWARAHGKPIVTTVHTKYSEKIANTIGDNILGHALYRRFLAQVNATDLVTCPGTMVAQELVERGLDPTKLRIVPNGVSPWLEAERPLSEDLLRHDALARRILDARASRKAILLFVGQLVREKNPDFLLDSIAVLEREGTAFLALIVGHGDRASALQQQAAALGLHEQVVFVGPVTDRRRLSMIYALSDLMTFPSTFECCPLVVMEAAQHRLPTLGIAGATGVSELITDGETGFLCPLYTTVYARCIRGLLDNPALLATVGDRAKRTIVRDQRHMSADFVALYRELLFAHRRRPEARSAQPTNLVPAALSRWIWPRQSR